MNLQDRPAQEHVGLRNFRIDPEVAARCWNEALLVWDLFVLDYSVPRYAGSRDNHMGG